MYERTEMSGLAVARNADGGASDAADCELVSHRVVALHDPL